MRLQVSLTSEILMRKAFTFLAETLRKLLKLLEKAVD